MYLIVGLGNPGADYAGNRHNIGFMLIDALRDRCAAGPERRKFSALVSEAIIGTEKVFLMKPQTYMNLSGQSVLEAANFYKLNPGQIIVFHDELDLSEGRFRAKTGGGHAGHNGLKSIQSHLGPNFIRGRMGIGHPGDKDRVTSHVLSDFTKSEMDWVEAMINACCRQLPVLFLTGTEAYQNAVMADAPAPSPSIGRLQRE